MTFETETVLDRRRLRRRLSLWRGAGGAGRGPGLGARSSSRPPRGVGLTERRQIARVSLEGIITEDRDQLKLLKQLAENKQVAAVILFINSPGGTTTGGEALFEAIRELAKTKPVVAQFGTVATSAAYIAGLATDHIVARGNTITGSVGVIFQWAEVCQLLDKLGVKMNEIKSGPLKANPSPFQPLGRGRQGAGRADGGGVASAGSWAWWPRGAASTPPASPGLEQGRVFSGREAFALKLIDQIGGEPEAVSTWKRSAASPRD